MKGQALLLAAMAFLGGAVASAVGLRIGGARANVPPAGEQLFFAGTAIDDAGNALTGAVTSRCACLVQ